MLFSYTSNTLGKHIKDYVHRIRRSLSMATIANIMVQVQGYICYTLFNILCIITLNIIIINSHNTSPS